MGYTPNISSGYRQQLTPFAFSTFQSVYVDPTLIQGDNAHFGKWLHLSQFDSGRLIIVVSIPDAERDAGTPGNGFIMPFFSDDDGDTWFQPTQNNYTSGPTTIFIPNIGQTDVVFHSASATMITHYGNVPGDQWGTGETDTSLGWYTMWRTTNNGDTWGYQFLISDKSTTKDNTAANLWVLGDRLYAGEYETNNDGVGSQGVLAVFEWDGTQYNHISDTSPSVVGDPQARFGKNAQLIEPYPGILLYLTGSSGMDVDGGIEIRRSMDGGTTWAGVERIMLSGIGETISISPNGQFVIADVAGNNTFRIYDSFDNWVTRTGSTFNWTDTGASFTLINPGCIRWISNSRFIAIGARNEIAAFEWNGDGFTVLDEWVGSPDAATDPDWVSGEIPPGLGDGEGGSMEVMPDKNLLVVGHQAFARNGAAFAETGAAHIIKWIG